MESWVSGKSVLFPGLSFGLTAVAFGGSITTPHKEPHTTDTSIRFD